MASTYVYTDPEPRTYPDVGIGEVSKGDEREFTKDTAPGDGRWELKAAVSRRAHGEKAKHDEPGESAVVEPAVEEK